jgi:hypothetical protein
MEQIYMYTPAVHVPATKNAPDAQNLIFLVPYTTLAPTFGQALKRALLRH